MTDLWPPSTTLEALQMRAALMKHLRKFFDARDVMEVETPLLCRHTNLDPYLESINVHYGHQLTASKGSPALTSAEPDVLFLQTSPEFAMKRLLASGCGSIYQLSKAFRFAELGRHHNPEFGILEWYQVGLDYRQLMNVVADLVTQLFAGQGKALAVQEFSYQAVFQTVLDLDPHRCSDDQLRVCANKIQAAGGLDAVALFDMGRDELLDYLFAFQIEPTFDKDKLTFVYDYPLSQSPLAKQKLSACEESDSDACSLETPELAERFEVFVAGMELGNGYSELTDWRVQQQRFVELQKQRATLGKPYLDIDARLISALKQGMPECAGVALGMDRLTMAILGVDDIEQVVAFPFSRA